MKNHTHYTVKLPLDIMSWRYFTGHPSRCMVCNFMGGGGGGGNTIQLSACKVDNSSTFEYFSL